MSTEHGRLLREAYGDLPACPVHEDYHAPARCETDGGFHPVVCKPKPKVEKDGRLPYGMGTLPKEFWTK